MTDSQCAIDINDIPAGNTISISLPIKINGLDGSTRYCKQIATATMEAHSFVTRKQVDVYIRSILSNCPFSSQI